MNDLVERLRRGAPGLYAEAMAWAELWDLMDNEQEPPMTTPRTVRRVLLVEAATDRSWSPEALTQAINEDPGDAPLGRDVVVHGALDLADLADILRTTRRLAAQITEGRSAAALTHLTDKILASFDTLIPTSIRRRVDPPRHNHPTRDVKPVGKCPACDLGTGVWQQHEIKEARKAAREAGCQLVALVYEYSDSELVYDYTDTDTDDEGDTVD